MSLHYFELPKLSEKINISSGKELWLKLFKADTEDELEKIEALEVPIMSEAIRAYRHVAASPEFREIERVRSKARHDEAQALRNARKIERQLADEEWRGVVAEKDIALANKDIALVNKDIALANKDAENEQLRQQLNELHSKLKKQ